jgi:hypothetical protein
MTFFPKICRISPWIQKCFRPLGLGSRYMFPKWTIKDVLVCVFTFLSAMDILLCVFYYKLSCFSWTWPMGWTRRCRWWYVVVFKYHTVRSKTTKLNIKIVERCKRNTITHKYTTTPSPTREKHLHDRIISLGGRGWGVGFGPVNLA